MLPHCEGDTVCLRPVQIDDVPSIVKWKKDPVVQRMALYPGADITVESQEKDVKRVLTSDNEVYLIVVIKKTDKPIGYIRMNFWEGQPGCAWLRFALGEERGKGYGKDAVQCLISYFFKEGMHRIDAEVYGFNTVCLGLLTSLGFVKEGVKRRAFFDGETYVDLIVFGLLKEDLE